MPIYPRRSFLPLPLLSISIVWHPSPFSPLLLAASASFILLYAKVDSDKYAKQKRFEKLLKQSCTSTLLAIRGFFRAIYIKIVDSCTHFALQMGETRMYSSLTTKTGNNGEMERGSTLTAPPPPPPPPPPQTQTGVGQSLPENHEQGCQIFPKYAHQ